MLFLTGIFVFTIFVSVGASKPGKLAKVDFMSDLNLSDWSPGRNSDNFGTSLGLANSFSYFLKFVSIIPDFSYKSFAFYYAVPVLLAGITCFLWISNLFKDRKSLDSNLIAAYAVFFLFNSIVFSGVFLYGWNLLTLIPLAGLALACLGIDKYIENKRNTHLALIAIGSFAIGGMIQFLFFLILYAAQKQVEFRQRAIILSTVVISELYVLLPEIYLNLLGDQPYYRGVDPIQQTKDIQSKLFLVDRISGTFDPVVWGHWNRPVWIFLAILGLAGFYSWLRRGQPHRGLVFAIAFFFLLNFSGIFWEISLNRIWTYLPIVGGMFRNPDKIFILFSLGIFIFASYWLSRYRYPRYLLFIIVIATSSNFYFNNSIQSRLDIASLKVPASYEKLEDKFSETNEPKRVLLLPFPRWFHFYEWSSSIQTQNVLRQVLTTPVVSDEFGTLDNISEPYQKLLGTMQSIDCDAAKKSSLKLGITDVVLQKDLIGSESDFKSLEKNLSNCFNSPYFDSRELSVFDTAIDQGSILTDYRRGQEDSNRRVTETFLGFEVCKGTPEDSVYLLKEQTSDFTYLNLQGYRTLIQGIAVEDGWRAWRLASQGCYQFVNVNSVLSIMSFVLSVGWILYLLSGKWISCRLQLLRIRLSAIIHKSKDPMQ